MLKNCCWHSPSWSFTDVSGATCGFLFFHRGQEQAEGSFVYQSPGQGMLWTQWGTCYLDSPSELGGKFLGKLMRFCLLNDGFDAPESRVCLFGQFLKQILWRFRSFSTGESEHPLRCLMFFDRLVGNPPSWRVWIRKIETCSTRQDGKTQQKVTCDMSLVNVRLKFHTFNPKERVWSERSHHFCTDFWGKWVSPVSRYKNAKIICWSQISFFFNIFLLL